MNILPGIFTTNKYDVLWDEILEDGISLDYEEHRNSCTNADHEDCFSWDWSSLHDWVYGFKTTQDKKSAWYWFNNLGYGYEPDPSAEYSAVVKNGYAKVIKSNYTTKCRLYEARLHEPADKRDIAYQAFLDTKSLPKVSEITGLHIKTIHKLSSKHRWHEKLKEHNQLIKCGDGELSGDLLCYSLPPYIIEAGREL